MTRKQAIEAAVRLIAETNISHPKGWVVDWPAIRAGVEYGVDLGRVAGMREAAKVGGPVSIPKDERGEAFGRGIEGLRKFIRRDANALVRKLQEKRKPK